MKLLNSTALLLAVLMLTSPSVMALKDDAVQPIHITSDNQSLDMGNRIVTFYRNVVITQGSILIKADKVIITRPSKNSSKKETLDAFGKPVIFHQLSDNGSPIDGHADKVHYDLGTEFLVLTGNAELRQFDSKINSEYISYDVKKQQLKANGSEKSRVQTLLIPSQLKQKGKK